MSHMGMIGDPKEIVEIELVPEETPSPEEVPAEREEELVPVGVLTLSCG